VLSATVLVLAGASVVGLGLLAVAAWRRKPGGTFAWWLLACASLLLQAFTSGLIALVYVEDKYTRLGFVDGGGADGSAEMARLWVRLLAVLFIAHSAIAATRYRSQVRWAHQR
jgi:hypothetical protein